MLIMHLKDLCFKVKLHSFQLASFLIFNFLIVITKGNLPTFLSEHEQLLKHDDWFNISQQVL